jgi:hypothetical protein
MFAAFAKGVGNFGAEVQGRMFVPEKAMAKFSGTGNYVFRILEDAEEFRAKHGSYVAIVPINELTRIIEAGNAEKRMLIEEGCIQEKDFRLRRGEDMYTLGVVFHERLRTEAETKATRDVEVLTSEPVFSIVLKRENMLGQKLDSTNRIPWGTASGIFHCEATARSMKTIVGLTNLALRSKEGYHNC